MKAGQKIIWTKIYRVSNKSDIDVHTYKSIQNPKHGDGRDLFPVVLEGVSFTLSHPMKILFF